MVLTYKDARVGTGVGGAMAGVEAGVDGAIVWVAVGTSARVGTGVSCGVGVDSGCSSSPGAPRSSSSSLSGRFKRILERGLATRSEVEGPQPDGLYSAFGVHLPYKKFSMPVVAD